MESDELKSPVRKLVRFFRSSRDGWKSKYQEAKRNNKRLVNQVRVVEKSREHWKGSQGGRPTGPRAGAGTGSDKKPRRLNRFPRPRQPS